MDFTINLEPDEIYEILNKAVDEDILREEDVIHEIVTRYGTCFDDHHSITERCMKIIRGEE